ncbi:MAG: methyl-accepting chemotaxis protein [Pseudomonadota bacterium]
MKHTVGTKIAAGFGAVMAIFVAVGAISYHGTSQLIDAGELQTHTYEVLTTRDEAQGTLKDTAIALRTYLLTGDARDAQRLQEVLAGLGKSLPALRALVADNPPQVERVDRVAELFRQYEVLTARVVEARQSRGIAAATELMTSEATGQLFAALRGPLNDITRVEQTLLKERSAKTRDDADGARWAIVVGTATAFVLAALAGWLITRNIATPLQRLTGAAERITLGDLSAPIATGTRNDEIGVLSNALARMTQALRGMAATAESITAGDLRGTVQPQSEADVLGNAFARMTTDLRSQIGELIEGTSVLSSAASEIVASSSQLAASASQSAAAVSETTATVEEVRQTAQLASQKARNVSDIAQKAVLVSDAGRQSTQDVEAGIVRIRRQMDLVASSMVRLSEQSQAVSQIIATVEDIATQSNMLAVNAAIEAAKAGEHGRGFGVVAQEVKSLAEQSRQATSQVRTILGDIQKATAGAVMATEEGGKAVEAGIRQTEIAGGAIQALSVSVNESAQAATQIAASSQQQLVGVDQVAGAMESIRQASAQNVASATQLETTARSLEQLGRQLKQMTERYKV